MQETIPCGTRTLELGSRTYVMGILNVTPDSFSDGGRYTGLEEAVAHARQMVAEGADLIDVGGESTRPGYGPVPPQEELARVVPVIERLQDLGVPISIDTQKPVVARAALEAGAQIINDIWGLQREPELAAIAAHYRAPVIVMHNQEHTQYENLMQEIASFLRRSREIAVAAGVPKAWVIVDPGIGFGKTAQQNLEVLRRLGELKALGQPMLLGTSRKSTIGQVLGGLPPHERVEGTGATVALGIAQGVDIVRVHDVQAMVRVARMSDAIIRGGWPER